MKKIFLTIALAGLMVFGSTAAYAALSTSQDPSGGYNSPLMTPSTYTNPLHNANNTGAGVNVNDGSTLSSVLKSVYSYTYTPGGATPQMTKDTNKQKIHGSYQYNTNACASCHQVHTGQAANLLFQDSVYDACTACHDGTLGFYNVFQTDPAKIDASGTFAGTDKDGNTTYNASMHMANDTVAIMAAPGGAVSTTGMTTGGQTAWGGEFDCASCHSPHGSYSDRLLSYNPGGMATVSINDGGLALVNVSVYNISSLPDISTQANYTAAPRFIAVYGDAAAIYAASNTNFAFANGLSGTLLFTAEKWVDHGAYFWKKAQTAYLRGGNYGSPPYCGIYKPSGTAGATTATTWNYAGGYATTTLDMTVYSQVYVSQGYVVRFNLTASPDPNLAQFNVTTSNDSSLWAGGSYKNWGLAVSGYCTTCHVDYYANSGNPSGHFEQAYRHTTKSDSYTCLRCHYAHGTTVDIMHDAEGLTPQQLVDAGRFSNIADARDYMKDGNPSSALKKFTNMSICWACHTSSHSVDLTNFANTQTGVGFDTLNQQGLVPKGLPTGF